MKRQNTTLTTTNPQDALVTALAKAIVNAKAADGTNPIMEALAQATGYQVVPAVPATPKPHKKHNCYANTSKLTSDGRPSQQPLIRSAILMTSTLSEIIS